MIRAWLRLPAVALWCLAAVPVLAAVGLVALGRPTRLRRCRTFLMSAYSRGICALLGVQVAAHGPPPPPGPTLVAPNHWSYLDIFVLGSLYRGLFVSRADVADWPVFGYLARSAGTLFVRREVRRDAVRVGAEIADALRAGHRVTAFLEGGSGPGTTVRPFRSALLEPAAGGGVACVPVAIRYELPRDPDLDPSRVVAWTEGGFVAHVARLARTRRIVAQVTFLPPRTGADRKALARGLESDVAAALARR